MKKYKSLYINGCSITWGHGVRNEKDKWPYLLSKKLNIPIYKNSSLSGNSMEGILNSTINDLHEQKNTLCIIGLTYVDRNTFSFGNHQYNYSTNSYEYATGTMADWHKKHFSNKRRYYWENDKDENNNLRKIFVSYANFLNDLVRYDKKFSSNIYRKNYLHTLLLQSYLENKKIDYVFIEWEDLLKCPNRCSDVKKFKDRINTENILKISRDRMNIGNHGHPSEQGCKNISDDLVEFINII